MAAMYVLDWAAGGVAYASHLFLISVPWGLPLIFISTAPWGDPPVSWCVCAPNQGTFSQVGIANLLLL
jgi:hypothetical protein